MSFRGGQEITHVSQLPFCLTFFEITSVIDWQAVHVASLFLQVGHPALLEFDGPIPEGLKPTQLPDNFEGLSA